MDFATQLKSWCETPLGEPFLRPFAPNADWKGAEVFIIGTNPATPLRDEFPSFNAYWNGLTVDRQLFDKEYERKHGGGSSMTSVRVGDLVKALRPINCLVTNASWIPASSPKSISGAQWKQGTECLKALVRYCRPKVLFCHGSKARAFASSLGANVDPYQPAAAQDTVCDGMLVLGYHHFTGQGLRPGATFNPGADIPVFVNRIRSHILRINK